MTQRSPRTIPPTTLGIDIGDRKSHVCVLDHAGEVSHETVIRSTGGFLLSSAAPHLDRYFVEGEEIVTFDDEGDRSTDKGSGSLRLQPQ